MIFNNRKNIVVVQNGQIIDGFNSEALIIRDENIVQSPVAGKVSIFADNNKRTSSGNVIMKIISNSSNRTIYNREAGIVSFQYDNLENEINLKNLSSLSLDKFSKISNNFNSIKENDYVKKGDPLYRLINNRKMLLVFRIDRENIERYWINETVFVNNDNSSELLEAKVIDIIKEEKDAFLVIELNRFISDLINLRKKEFHFVKNIYKGLMIPATAVFPTTDDYKVVLVEENNSKKLEDVEIVFKDEEHVIVEGLEIGDEVLKDPAKENIKIGGSNNE